MPIEEDNWMVRMIKGNIATWTSRVEMAQRLGNTQLLQKALKYKTKYEKELAALKQLEADAEERDRLQMLNPDQPEQTGCHWCAIFENAALNSYDVDLGALDEFPEFVREILRDTVAAMGVTDSEMQDMETGFAAAINESSACDKCRIEQNKILAMYRLMRESVRTET
jgi:hypothetical protein